MTTRAHGGDSKRLAAIADRIPLSGPQLLWLIIGGLVLVVLGAVVARYWAYFFHPWTRDGQVMAQVIQVTPRVSGPLVRLPVEDNQFVKKGDLLFEIDPRTFKAALDQATADLDVARIRLENERLQEKRFREAIVSGSVSEIELELQIDQRRAAEAKLRAAEGKYESKRLDFEFTQYRAPVNGYITNLTLRLGSHAVANKALMALVDVDSYWVFGYFRETSVRHIRPGNTAILTLMTYPNLPIKARVESLGWGTEPDDGTTGEKLLPQVDPTFDWIRLAQRVPVRIALDEVPDEIDLRVGMTATVVVLTDETDIDAAAIPRFLQ